MFKGSLDEKNPKFFMKNKTYSVEWDQQNYRYFRSLCFESNRRFAAKTKLELDTTNPQSLQRPKMEKLWQEQYF